MSTLGILIGKAKPAKGDADEGGPEEEASEGHDEAADEVFDAMAAKERGPFREALRAYVEMCVADAGHMTSDIEAKTGIESANYSHGKRGHTKGL